MSDDESSEEGGGRVMLCHYEVMELEHNCKSDEIKRQYKVLALRYHPDRNHGDVENATTKFKQLSAAYAVLSDPHERTWYDDHREAILRGGNGIPQDDDDYDDEVVDVWRYFNANCYNGTSDESPTGFYNVYRGCFEEILEGEGEVSKAERNKGCFRHSFGKSTTPIADVIDFYNEWENFTTCLNFAWADMYHPHDAPNRDTRRVMEKENLKARAIAKKEFIAQIRSLVKFVKKLDPRVLAYENAIKERRLLEEERKRVQKLEEIQKRKEMREQRRLEHENDTAWVQARDNERKAAFLLADNSDEDETTIKTSGGLCNYDSDYEKNLRSRLREVVLDDVTAGERGFINTAAPSSEPAAESEAVDDDDEDLEGFFHCALCEKSFQTAEQLAHHNISRPHKKKAMDQVKAQKKAPKGKEGAVVKEEKEKGKKPKVKAAKEEAIDLLAATLGVDGADEDSS